MFIILIKTKKKKSYFNKLKNCVCAARLKKYFDLFNKKIKSMVKIQVIFRSR